MAMNSNNRRTVKHVAVTLLILAVVGFRFERILNKAERKRQAEESVTPRTVWDVVIPDDEFVGDLSQVGHQLLFVEPGPPGAANHAIFVRELDYARTTEIETLPGWLKPFAPLSDLNIVGPSARGRRQFRLERERGRTIVAQYNVSTGARGVLARMPATCSEFKTVLALPNHFFALETICTSENNPEARHKRIIVINLEDRRLTYASPLLSKSAAFIALQ
jgi:hypothetical protein